MHKFMFFERKTGLIIDAHSLIMEDNNPVKMIPKRDQTEVLNIPRDVRTFSIRMKRLARGRHYENI